MQLSDSSNGLTALAEAPTPAYGHPFPKEGELRPRRFFCAVARKRIITRVQARNKTSEARVYRFAYMSS